MSSEGELGATRRATERANDDREFERPQRELRASKQQGRDQWNSGKTRHWRTMG
jgi:hypothetical protein